ncbi:MAG: 16S rRNA (guanine(966)-N(2))-methyltransferase RsmD [Amaricoccus sp.]|uniref:16S rRNA (guanine(966)-N(2))-methyltransferase RsmD n=1 Tax=Amaricoccus sp. TaxID=1872485 RepID=UPI0039E5F4A1
MRIISGRWRGTALVPVGAGDEAARLRPTTDRVRESLFNLLAHGGHAPIDGARVLDLFAGTGALGLEALSRGAASATFVEQGRPALKLLGANLARVKAGDAAHVLPRDATRLGVNPGAPATMVFLDPPYGRGLGEQAIASALAGGWIAPGATIAWEEGVHPAALPGLTLRDHRQYGDSMVFLYELTAP